MLNQLQTIKTLISNGESQTLEFKTSFFKEAGMAFICMFLGYLVGERKDKK